MEKSAIRRFQRVKTPTLIQMEAVECGAASLGIILGYYRRFVSLEELRVACGVSRDGSNILNIKRAAAGYGLDTKVYRADPDDLPDLGVPFIIFWNYNHFLVVEGFSSSKVYLNDPGEGPRTVSYEEFEKQYSGIVITFTKMENFQTGGIPSSIWPGLKERLRRVKSPLSYLLFAAFCLMLASIIPPGYSKVFFDTILGEEVYDWADWYIASFAAVAILMGSLIWLQQYLLMRLNSKLSIQFSSDYLAHILKLPISFYQQRFGGEIAYRLSLNDSIIDALTGSLATSIISIIFVALYGLLLFSFNWMIATIAVLSSAINFLTMILIQRFRNDAYALLQQDYGKFMGFAIGGIYYIESIKATGSEGDFFARLMGYFTRTLNTQQKLGRVNALFTSLPVLLDGLTTMALFGIGGWLMMTENFTIGLFMAMQLIIANFSNPIKDLMGLGTVIQTVKIDMARIDDVMKNPIDPLFLSYKQGAEGAEKQLDGNLELRDVTFGYSPLDPPLIQNLSFKLAPGQRIALVGSTGCGKTTIGRLVSGLLSPWSGEVLYDGKKREELSREEILVSLATIDQDIFLFAGSIRDNLTLFDHTFTDDEIIRAAKDAAIHEEILQKPGGYEYLLTEGGTNLSGGQRQRIEIARGLLLNPTLLVLDEATSALDSKTEERVIKNIRERGCTCIMVAHRLSTIRDCDEIIVLEKGAVVQRGTHESLKQTPGIYRELVLRDI